MKKLRFAFVLLLCLGVFLCLCSSAYAEPAVIDSGTCGADGDNLTWTLYDTGELVIDGTGAMADYEYYYHSQDDQGCTAPWYENRLEINTVTIRDDVTSIGWYAFRNCSGLTSVTIPESVMSIGSSAFSGCSSLTSVTIPESVMSIGSSAFSGCSSLTSMTIPEGVTSIGRDAFSDCSGLTSVTIPDSVTSIGERAFYNCSSLTSVAIPEGVTSVGERAFYNCSSLTSVTIPDSVTNIGIWAFDDCSSLTAIHITSLEAWCGINLISEFPASYDLYLNDVLVTELIIPDSVTSIGSSAFYGCSSLTSVTIPESVTSIGERAFWYCSSLMSVTIQAGVTSIGDYAFDGCSSLTSVTIPESVTRISYGSFENCSSLTSVTIPESVTSIGYYAFDGCSGLTSVTIPESVTYIGYSAFDGCNNLTDVYYGGSETQWKAIRMDSNNDTLKNATIHCTPIYIISYDPNGGKDAPASQEKPQKIPRTLSNTRPTREKVSAGTYSVRLNPNVDGQSISSVLRATRTTAYSFKGWNTAADGSGTDYAPGASYTADADVTLYAQWESTTEAATITLPELARDDAVFKGWAENRNAESGVVGEYTPTGNVTLYAVWHRADLVLPASLNTVESEAFTGGAFTYVFIPETVTRIEGGAFASCPKLACAQFAGADTEIDPTAFDGVTGLTIIAPGGSTAESFAAAHGFDFLPAA